MNFSVIKKKIADGPIQANNVKHILKIGSKLNINLL